MRKAEKKIAEGIDLPEAYFERAEARTKVKEYSLTVQDYLFFIFPKSYGCRGFIRSKNSNLEGALEDCNKALALEENRWHYNVSGRYWLEKGKRLYIGTYIAYEEVVRHRFEIKNLIHDGFVKAYYGWVEKAELDSEWAGKNQLIFEVQKNNGEFQIITNEDIRY